MKSSGQKFLYILFPPWFHFTSKKYGTACEKKNNKNKEKKHFDFPRKVLCHVFTDKLVDEDKFKRTTSALWPQRVSSI